MRVSAITPVAPITPMRKVETKNNDNRRNHSKSEGKKVNSFEKILSSIYEPK